MQLQQLQRMPDGAADTEAAGELGGLTSLQALLSDPQVTTATVTMGGMSGPSWPYRACTLQGGPPHTWEATHQSARPHSCVQRTQCSFQNKLEYDVEWRNKLHSLISRTSHSEPPRAHDKTFLSCRYFSSSHLLPENVPSSFSFFQMLELNLLTLFLLFFPFSPLHDFLQMIGVGGEF